MSTLPKNKFHEKQQQVYKYDWFCAIIQKNDRETDVYETYGRIAGLAMALCIVMLGIYIVVPKDGNISHLTAIPDNNAAEPVPDSTSQESVDADSDSADFPIYTEDSYYSGSDDSDDNTDTGDPDTGDDGNYDQGYTPDDGNVNDTSDPDTSQGDDTGDTGDVVDDGTDTGDNSDSELDDSSSGDTGDDTVEVY